MNETIAADTNNAVDHFTIFILDVLDSQGIGQAVPRQACPHARVVRLKEAATL
jgi:hypothetical protein